MTPGEAIRKAREAAGMSQTELAKAIGTSQQLVSKLEKGDRYPPRDLAIACAKVLNVSQTYILTGFKEKIHDLPASKIGLEESNIEKLLQMDERYLSAVNALLNDDLFIDTLTAYMFDDTGIWKDGEQIASPQQEITFGKPGDFSMTYTVSDITRQERERILLNLLRDIRKEVKKE